METKQVATNAFDCEIEGKQYRVMVQMAKFYIWTWLNDSWDYGVIVPEKHINLIAREISANW